MPVFLKKYLLSQELIGRDILMLYRNFWHWNFSKVIILVACLLGATLLSLPFIAVMWWLVTNIVESLDSGVLSRLISSGVLDPAGFAVIMNNGWSIGAIILSGIAMLATFFIFLSYGYFLLLRVYDSYLAGDKLPLKANFYWKPQYILKYAGLFAWTTLYILIPIVVGILYFLWLFSLEQMGFIDVKNDLQKQILGVLGLIGIAGTIAGFIFMIIRTMTGNMFFLQWKPTESVTGRSFVQASWNLTRGSVGKVILLLIPAIIFTSLVTYGIERVRIERDIYSLIERTNLELGTVGSKYRNDHEYINLVLAPGTNLSEKDESSRDRTAMQFTPSMATADRQYIRAMYPYIIEAGGMNTKSDTAWVVWGALLSFFILEGIMLMVYFSIFHILQTASSEWKGKKSTLTSPKVASTSTSRNTKPKKKVTQTAPASDKKLVTKVTVKKSSAAIPPAKKSSTAPKKTPLKKK